MIHCFRQPITMPLPPTSLDSMSLQASERFPCIGCPPQGYIGLCLRQTYWLALLLPLALSILTGWLLIQASRHSRTVARKWLILCPLLGLLDGAILTLAIGEIVHLGGW